MKDIDIEKLRKILISKERVDLADLFIHSRSFLNESSSFGTKLYSILSTFDVYSPVSYNEKLLRLNEFDKSLIFKSIRQIYPLKEDAPEITCINYYVDFELDEIDLVKTGSLNTISFDYIKEQINKCENKIREQDYEGAITNARNLIESICLYILETLTNKEYIYDGNLLKLYKKVSNTLNLNPSIYADENLKQILSGIISQINGISGLRNNYSDAHGSSPSQKKYKIDNRHAVLAVNSSKTISEYLYNTFEKQKHNL